MRPIVSLGLSFVLLCATLYENASAVANPIGESVAQLEVSSEESREEELRELIELAHAAESDAIAEALWQAVIQVDATYLTAYNNLAIALANQGKLRESIETSLTAYDIDPDYAFAAYNASLVLNSVGEFSDADWLLQSVITLELSTAVDYSALGVALYDDGSRSFIETAVQANVQPAADNAFAHVSQGTALLKREDFTGAEAAFQSALRLDADNAVAIEGLGHSLYAQGQVGAAMVVFQRLDSLEDPNRLAVARRSLGYELGEQGRYDEAAIAFQQAILQATAIDPSNGYPFRAFLHEELGEVLFRLGQYDEAEAAFRDAIALWIEDGSGVGNRAYTSLGSLLMVTGELGEAEATFREYIARSPNPVDGYALLGHLLYLQSRYEDAETEIALALQSYPDYVESLQSAPASYSLSSLLSDYGLAYRVLGDVRLKQRRFEEATEALRLAVELAPLDMNAHLSLGLALISQLKLAEAEAVYRAAVDLDPQDSAMRAALELVVELRQTE